MTIAGITARGFPIVASISVWPTLVFVAWLGVMYLTYRYRGLPRWTPTKADDVPRSGLDGTPPPPYSFTWER